MSDWNSEQYLKFEQERTQPSIDLVNRIAHSAPHKIIDVGCGPGNSTAVLAQRFPAAAILGLDSSPGMVASARQNHPQLQFLLADASRDLPMLGQDFDIVFSNACIQWVPNHPQLLQDMMGLLRPGGVLAVQTPINEPMQAAIAEVAASGQWSFQHLSPRIFHNLSPGEYHDLLSAFSSNFSLWQTTYFHRMPSHHSIIEWYKGTGLRPYLDALPQQERPAFEEALLQKVQALYPPQKTGDVLFLFPRLFFTATR